MAKIMTELSDEEALVLHDLLSRFEASGKLLINHKSEEIVLWNLNAMLEKQLVEPFKSNYIDLLSAAKEKIAQGYQG